MSTAHFYAPAHVKSSSEMVRFRYAFGELVRCHFQKTTAPFSAV